jgi:hypothetical protein
VEPLGIDKASKLIKLALDLGHHLEQFTIIKVPKTI